MKFDGDVVYGWVHDQQVIACATKDVTAVIYADPGGLFSYHDFCFATAAKGLLLCPVLRGVQLTFVEWTWHGLNDRSFYHIPAGYGGMRRSCLSNADMRPGGLVGCTLYVFLFRKTLRFVRSKTGWDLLLASEPCLANYGSVDIDGNLVIIDTRNIWNDAVRMQGRQDCFGTVRQPVQYWDFFSSQNMFAGFGPPDIRLETSDGTTCVLPLDVCLGRRATPVGLTDGLVVMSYQGSLHWITLPRSSDLRWAWVKLLCVTA